MFLVNTADYTSKGRSVFNYLYIFQFLNILNSFMKKVALHWKILIGMVLGIAFGFVMNSVAGGKGFVTDWIKPF